jgi:23S rRNA (cytosine1962-C5)-methyltransferase
MSRQARIAEGLLSSHESIPLITVSARGATRLKSGHLWVYRSDLAKAGEVAPGAFVHVQDERGRKLGSALYSSSSQIAIRLLTSAVIAESQLQPLVRERIGRAVNFRKQFARDTDSCRVIFSEADLLPGLIIDKYHDVLSMQIVTQAFDRQDIRQTLTDAMAEHFPSCSLFERVDPHIRQLEQLPPRESQLIQGERSSTIFTLNGVRFHFDALGGQKTGAFLDQRQNYAAAARYAHGEALDCFTYQGGFALHLARVCSKVTAVDSSRPALEVAEQNEQLNREAHVCGEIEWVEANAFDLLKDYSTAGQQYDTIVLDPPAFAKTKRVLETAIRGYKELNLRAVKMLRPGGVLVTCSCSFHVSEGEFLEMLGSAAADAGRRVRILEKRGAALDHPTLSGVPETSYLKCIICQVIE